MTRNRIFTLLTAVAVTTFAAPVARAAEPSAPLLWEGTIRAADGQPAAGTEVVAFARPAAADLRPTEANLVPVARTTTDDAGHYVLRSGNTEALRAVETESGWTNVMVAAFGRDGGFSLATDSVAWVPVGGFRAAAVDDNPNHGRWATTPGERAAAEAGTFRAAAAPDQASLDRERPTVMTLTGTSDRPITAQGAKPPPMRQYGMCAGPYKTERIPAPDQGNFTPVGEMHLEQSWSGQFAYTTTRSTSFQVGVQREGEAWSVGGSSSTVKETTSRSGSDSGLTENHMYSFAADIDYVRTTWNCNRADRWQRVDMIEPSFWRGGILQTDRGAPPACDAKNTSPVPPNGYHVRGDKESTTLQGAVSVIGFSGSVTTTVSKGVFYRWDNHVPRTRYLCGQSGYISQDTRIASLR